MPLYVRLIKLREKGVRDATKLSELSAKTRKILEDNGCRLVEAYATLGRYDFVAIIGAPDNETAAKVSALIAALGVRAETLPAVKFDEFIASLA